MSASFFRGTQLDQNVKFKDKEKEIIKQWKWPPEFDEPVNLNLVQLDVIKIWIERRITELIGFEDEILINLAIAQLEEFQFGNADTFICPKRMQIKLTGFMEDKASIFMHELWNLLLSAQKEPSGIPPSLIREKLDEKQRKLEQIENTKRQIEKIKGFSNNLEPIQRDFNFSKAKKYNYQDQNQESNDKQNNINDNQNLDNKKYKSRDHSYENKEKKKETKSHKKRHHHKHHHKHKHKHRHHRHRSSHQKNEDEDIKKKKERVKSSSKSSSLSAQDDHDLTEIAEQLKQKALQVLQQKQQ